MTARAIPNIVRRSEVWGRLKEVLSEFDVTPKIGRGSKHWYVEIEIGHTPRKHFFSPSMGDPRSCDNSASQLRRVILSARANIGKGTS